MIGNKSAGKTKLLERFVNNIWEEKYISTIGVDFVRYNTKYNQIVKLLDIDTQKIKLQLWDLAGDDKFKGIIRCYFKGVRGFVVVYNITDRKSFDDLNSWLSDIENLAKSNAVKILVGSQCDREDERKVSYQEGKNFAESNGMKFLEASAKTGQNVQEIFEYLVKEIMAINPAENNAAQNKINII